MRINYVTERDVVVNTSLELSGDDGVSDWLHHMVAQNPTTNFFLTTDTTDIFKD